MQQLPLYRHHLHCVSTAFLKHCCSEQWFQKHKLAQSTMFIKFWHHHCLRTATIQTHNRSSVWMGPIMHLVFVILLWSALGDLKRPKRQVLKLNKHLSWAVADFLSWESYPALSPPNTMLRLLNVATNFYLSPLLCFSLLYYAFLFPANFTVQQSGQWNKKKEGGWKYYAENNNFISWNWTLTNIFSTCPCPRGTMAYSVWCHTGKTNLQLSYTNLLNFTAKTKGTFFLSHCMMQPTVYDIAISKY